MHKEKEAHQSRPLKVGDRFNVLVERMATGGAGIAKHKKLVVFVPLACPDDELLVEVTRVKKSYVDAKIIEIIKPSVSRRSFYCSIANTCGGCQWQQIEYTQQLKQKKSLLLESLQRHGKLTNLPNINLIECDREFHYRNRVRLHWNGKILGFFTAKSHQLIRVDSCPLAEPSLNSQVPIILDWLKNNKIKKDADIDLFLDSNNLPQFKLKKTKNETFPFSQVNSLINKKLISYVLEKANEKYQWPLNLFSR